MRPDFIILLVSLLSVGQCQRLTEEENELRKKTCGTNLKLKSYRRKILNGLRSKISEAPWNVAVEVRNGVPGLCTGTLISPRHFITARHCFAALRPGSEYRWIAGPDEKVPGCDRDEEVDIVVEKNFGDMFKVFVGVDCGYRKNCPGRNFTEIGIRKLVFPKTCDDSQLDFDDFAIVELSENVTFSKKVRPICVAHEDVGLLDSHLLTKLYGFGLDPSKGADSGGPLRYETVETVQCPYKNVEKTFCSKSISGKQLACMGDSGGGVVRKVKGRVTLLGVIYEGTSCGSFTVNETDHIANAAFYSEDICKYTGICSKSKSTTETMKVAMKKQPVEPRSQEAAIASYFFEILITLSVVLS